MCSHNISEESSPTTEIVRVNTLSSDNVKKDISIRIKKKTPSSSITDESDYSSSLNEIDTICSVNHNSRNTDNNFNSIYNSPRYVFRKYKCSHKQFYVNYYIDEKDSSKIYKIIIFNHYGEDNAKLPLKGWIHHCLHCNTITGRYAKYITRNHIDICIQLCNKCKHNVTYSYNKNIQNVLKLDDNLEYDIQKILQEIKENTFL